MDKTRQLVHEANLDLGAAAIKGGGGFMATFAAMSINDIAGLIVAILTGIYMCFQIEAAWQKRKEAKKRRKDAE